MKSLIITILIVIFAIIIFARIRKLKLDEKAYQEAFDLMFNNQTIKPTYKYGSSYGWPTFTVIYPSESELIKAKEEGITKSFVKKIESLCKNIGSKSNPFDPELAIWFTYEGELEKIIAQGPTEEDVN